MPRYQTMRGRRVERRFGWDCHGLPAEVEAEKQLGITTQGRDPRAGRGQVQRGLPDLGAALHPGLGALRHPPGPLGRLRQRLQDARPGLHGERHVGVQDPARQGPGLRGLPGAGVLLALRDAAVQHRDPDGRRLPRPAGPGADRVFQLRRAGRERSLRLDHHAVDAAVQPRARGRPGHRVRGAGARRASGTSSARRGSARTRRSWTGCDPGRHACTGATWSGAATRRCSTSSSSRPARTRSRCSAADFVTTEDGTGVVHWRPAFGEDDQNACNAAGIPTVVTVDDHTRFTALVPPYQGLQVFEANKPVIRDLKAARAWCCGTTPTPTPTRTAGAATRRWSTRRCRRGSSR